MNPTYVVYNDRVILLSDLAKEFGISPGVVYGRYKKRGWSLEAALTTPVHKQETLTYRYKGKDYTIAELAQLNGTVTTESMRGRLKKMTVKAAVETPNTHPTRKKRIIEKRQKELCKPIAKKPDYTQCKTCQYHGRFSSGEGGGFHCGYSEVTGHCRINISPPSPNCTVYKKGKSLVRKAALKRYNAY